jgi:hypothetical protein
LIAERQIWSFFGLCSITKANLDERDFDRSWTVGFFV